MGFEAPKRPLHWQMCPNGLIIDTVPCRSALYAYGTCARSLAL